MARASKWTIAAGLCAAAAGTIALGQESGDASRGHEVFEHWCAPCHAPGPGHPGTQALENQYRGSKPAPLEQRTDLLPAITRSVVRSGVVVMPPFRKTEISDAELQALAAYLAPAESSSGGASSTRSR